MKKYRVYVLAGCSDGSDDETFLEFSDESSPEEIETACKIALAELIGDLDQGWHEVSGRKRRKNITKKSTIEAERVKAVRNDIEQTKLHLEYLRCAIADAAGTGGLREDMDALWEQMDVSTKNIVNRDVAPLVDGVKST